MADLHPIVIPPLEHTFKSIKYTCSGEGLYKDGYLYDPHADKLIPPKTVKANAAPKELEKRPVAYWKAQCAFRGLNQSGSINDLQLRIREAKQKLLPELKSAETELNKVFKKMNNAARDDSYGSLKTAEQKAKADPQKFLTQAFPKGGTGRPANLDLLVVKIGSDDRLALANAAEAMGLETVSVDAPWTGKKKPSPDRWIIVGRTRDAVWNQMRDIEREAARSKQTFASDKTKQPSKQDTKPPVKKKVKTPATAQSNANKTSIPPPSRASAVISRPDSRPTIGPVHVGGRPIQTPTQSAYTESRHSNPDILPHLLPDIGPAPSKGKSGKPTRTKAPPIAGPVHQGPRGSLAVRTAIKTAPTSGRSKPVKTETSSAEPSNNAWDVRGCYEIRCPEIEDQWSENPQSGDTTMKLDLFLETKQGKQQLFGIFDFRVLEGIMRFEKPIPVPKVDSAADSKKRKLESLDYDSDTEMNLIPEYNGVESSREYSETIFYLGAKDKPTARRPIWRYRWRGSETGEGEIQLYSDEKVQSITFSKKGAELEGTIDIDFIGICHFTGVKVGCGATSQLDPEEEWMNNGEEAHEYARTARWG